MRIKSNVNLAEFLIAVENCKGEVLFTTQDGDILNLKSVLSRYVFVVAVKHPELLADGTVICRKPEDTELLRKFITAS